MKPHQGKIVTVDLTNRSIETLPTTDYEEWIGGIGMDIAVFWDLVDKDYITDTENVTGFEPENVVTIFPGPNAGTPSPNSGRTEVFGLAPQAYPQPFVARSNFGGRWGPLLKYAGFDGVAIQGKADEPVYLEINDGGAQLKDASHLWGLGLYETEEELWREFGFDERKWQSAGGRQDRKTTQRPAVVGIGQAGENQCVNSALVHDVGSGAGQGGFGGVFGSKNLKAISTIGTQSVEVADPSELIETRRWFLDYHYDLEEAKATSFGQLQAGQPPSIGTYSEQQIHDGEEVWGRPLGCHGCTMICRANVTDGGEFPGGESQCVDAIVYNAEDVSYHGEPTFTSYKATLLLQDLTINAYEIAQAMDWLPWLHGRGKLGQGKEIDSGELDFDELGSEEFIEKFLKGWAYQDRDLIGDLADLGEGGIQYAAEKWGVLEESLFTEEDPPAYHQLYNISFLHHAWLISWGFQSIIGPRDINAHDLLYQIGRYNEELQQEIPAEKAVELLERITEPIVDRRGFDQSEDSWYSEHHARYIAAHRRYSKFKNTAQYCDWHFPSVLNERREDYKGLSPEAEVRFFNAVTGLGWDWEDCLDFGQRVWNFERAILVMNGKHRDKEYIPPYPPYDSYVHREAGPNIQEGSSAGDPVAMPVREDGEWTWEVHSIPLEREKFDELKSKYYEFEGWDTDTGWPRRETLEELELGFVADELEERGKLPQVANPPSAD